MDNTFTLKKFRNNHILKQNKFLKTKISPTVSISDGRTVGCKSGCVAYNNDQECCRGAFGTPDKCRQSRTAMLFKDACPTAYSYAYDDATSTFTCKNANYVVQFC